METIYEWLLHNVGNEGNSLTILNVQRQTNTEGISLLEVMARTNDFKRVNVFIEPVKKINPPDVAAAEFKDESQGDSYMFANENQVITYLAEGQSTQASTESAGIRVSVLEPTDDSTSLAFPPK